MMETVVKIERLVEQFIERHFSNNIGSGIAKLPEEAKEFIDNPSLDEGADVLLCVLIELKQRAWSLEDLLEATLKKCYLNEARKWERQPDGTIHHIGD